jgi:hypothetical protein
MGGACSTHGRDAYKILKGRDQLEDICIDGKIILEWILGK